MPWLILLSIISTIVLAVAISAALYFQQTGLVSLPLKPSQPVLLLVGPSNAGKTSLFQSLLYDKKDTKTYTSQKVNSGQLELDEGPSIRVVDVPGHPKLFATFTNYRPTAIAFVLDASTLSKNISDVAHSLVEVLTFARQQNVKEVAIFANKSDFFTALSKEKITQLFEAEIQQIREQKEGVQMDSIEETTNDDNDWLQNLVGQFRLADECALLSGSVLKGDIKDCKDWVVTAFA